MLGTQSDQETRGSSLDTPPLHWKLSSVKGRVQTHDEARGDWGLEG